MVAPFKTAGAVLIAGKGGTFRGFQSNDLDTHAGFHEYWLHLSKYRINYVCLIRMKHFIERMVVYYYDPALEPAGIMRMYHDRL